MHAQTPDHRVLKKRPESTGEVSRLRVFSPEIAVSETGQRPSLSQMVSAGSLAAKVHRVFLPQTASNFVPQKHQSLDLQRHGLSCRKRRRLLCCVANGIGSFVADGTGFFVTNDVNFLAASGTNLLTANGIYVHLLFSERSITRDTYMKLWSSLHSLCLRPGPYLVHLSTCRPSLFTITLLILASTSRTYELPGRKHSRRAP